MGRLDGKVALISGGARGQGATEGRMVSETVAMFESANPSLALKVKLSGPL